MHSYFYEFICNVKGLNFLNAKREITIHNFCENAKSIVNSTNTVLWDNLKQIISYQNGKHFWDEGVSHFFSSVVRVKIQGAEFVNALHEVVDHTRSTDIRYQSKIIKAYKGAAPTTEGTVLYFYSPSYTCTVPVLEKDEDYIVVGKVTKHEYVSKNILYPCVQK